MVALAAVPYATYFNVLEIERAGAAVLDAEREAWNRIELAIVFRRIGRD